MIQALIFDFDGLILDTETPDFDAWQEIYAEHGARLPIELWAQIIGGSGESDFDAAIHLEQLLGHPLDLPALNARWRERGHELLEGQSILPGVMEILADARRLGLRLAIASSSPHSWVDTHLARLGLADYFEIVKCRDDVPRTKPDPSLFLAALAAIHIRADEAIVFEDSANGVKAAKAAGIFTVAVPLPLTRHRGVNGADIVLPSLAETTLPALLARAGDDVEIRLETPEDIPGIRQVNALAFSRAAEADLVDLLRARGRAVLSLVAAQNGRVLGHVLFSPVALDPLRPDLLGVGLAPVAVLPEVQKRGIGSRLIRASLHLCHARGWDFVVLLGHPEYYPRFGLKPAKGFGLGSVYGDGEAFMVMELKRGALNGIAGRVEYSPEFAEMGC